MYNYWSTKSFGFSESGKGASILSRLLFILLSTSAIKDSNTSNILYLILYVIYMIYYMYP